jgi:5-formyltetrahydrofolate cyclo-ligase
MVVPPQSTKYLLRNILKTRRQAFVSQLKPSDRFSYLEAMTQLALSAARGGQSVALYHAIGDEIDPCALAQALMQHGVKLSLPHIAGRDAPMRFLSWTDGQSLVPGPFGVSQPPEDSADASPDIIFAPLLGFDRACNRIGYGAGYYDRAFARHPSARRIGLAWSAQACDAIPVDPWDVPLHGVVTENEWIQR